ncbi:hypothetical protein ONZ45_g9192 [Pleurotus djamor]|nr:hypothetical protein ONZ45_g9192 [Pleurotus djamor]
MRSSRTLKITLSFSEDDFTMGPFIASADRFGNAGASTLPWNPIVSTYARWSDSIGDVNVNDSASNAEGAHGGHDHLGGAFNIDVNVSNNLKPPGSSPKRRSMDTRGHTRSDKENRSMMSPSLIGPQRSARSSPSPRTRPYCVQGEVKLHRPQATYMIPEALRRFERMAETAASAATDSPSATPGAAPRAQVGAGGKVEMAEKPTASLDHQTAGLHGSTTWPVIPVSTYSSLAGALDESLAIRRRAPTLDFSSVAGSSSNASADTLDFEDDVSETGMTIIGTDHGEQVEGTDEQFDDRVPLGTPVGRDDQDLMQWLAGFYDTGSQLPFPLLPACSSD